MSQDTLYILTTPGEPPHLTSRNIVPVWLAYRISPGLRLMRVQGPPPSGGIMAICGEGNLSPTDPRPLCRTILHECAMRHFRGVLLDFDAPTPGLEPLVQLLARQNLTLFLPEWLAGRVPGCRVLVPSPLSGGSLELRLQEAATRFGADRIVLSLARTAEEFPLPCPTGSGRPLSPGELEQMTATLHPCPHLSPALCTRYFIHCRGDEARLVLYDDDETLQAKAACARRCGIFRFLFLQCDKPAVFPNFSPQ